mmetsp:Transcript_7654/g.15396  ORF Transcript_7654/g.15396 Transcript_7654/m.15396 type:complete len:208 (-) Transcript_7654:2247-2870(-)
MAQFCWITPSRENTMKGFNSPDVWRNNKVYRFIFCDNSTLEFSACHSSLVPSQRGQLHGIVGRRGIQAFFDIALGLTMPYQYNLVRHNPRIVILLGRFSLIQRTLLRQGLLSETPKVCHARLRRAPSSGYGRYTATSAHIEAPRYRRATAVHIVFTALMIRHAIIVGTFHEKRHASADTTHLSQKSTNLAPGFFRSTWLVIFAISVY